MKYLVGIPYLCRPDLLHEAIASIQEYWDHLVLLDNSGCKELSAQGFDQEFLVLEPLVPLSFAQSQNAFIRVARERGCDAYMYMHSDAVAGEGTPGRLLHLVQQLLEGQSKWGAVLTNHDTLAAYNMEAVDTVGQYDTVIQDNFSDNDYYRRMMLKGYDLIYSKLAVVHQNGGHNSMEHDPVLRVIFARTYRLYGQYYIAKWGGEPGREQYTIPFNGQENIMALLALLQQEYGPAATLEHVIEHHPGEHRKIQQAIRGKDLQVPLKWV